MAGKWSTPPSKIEVPALNPLPPVINNELTYLLYMYVRADAQYSWGIIKRWTGPENGMENATKKWIGWKRL